jgi:hypothetical protein
MPRMSTLLRSLCAVFLGSSVALSLANCSSDKPTSARGVAAGCVANSDCDKPLVCTFTICHRACKESRDCPNPSEHCLNLPEGSVCQLPEDGLTCTYSTDCKVPLKCAVDSKCRVACQGDGDCLGTTQVCVSHVCADKSEIDVRTKDLAHTNPVGGWNGKDDGPLSDAGTGGSPGAGGQSGGGGRSGSGGASNPPDSGPTPDSGPLACSGTGLAKFRPSNLPATLTFPSGLKPFTAQSCAFRTDSADPADPAITRPHFVYGCGAVEQPPSAVVTLSDGREAAVVFYDSVTLAAGRSLEVTGRRPLIIVSLGRVEINGTIQSAEDTVSGWYGGGAPGPTGLARPGICPIDTAAGGGRPGASVSTAGIGAGGGGFCGLGGAGSTVLTGTPPRPAGGTAYGTPELVPLVGGSSGGSTYKTGVGHGGGAVQIVSNVEIVIGDSGIINMGGGKGPNGDGAGSGGAILLEAPTVAVRGVLAANGGGAGEDGYGTANDALASDQPALGVQTGGDGGAGAKPNGSPGNQAAATQKLAGGGGGVGRIRINTGCGGTLTVTSSAVISPFKSTNCYTTGSID